MSIINRSTVKKSTRQRRRFVEPHAVEKRDLKFGEMHIPSQSPKVLAIKLDEIDKSS